MRALPVYIILSILSIARADSNVCSVAPTLYYPTSSPRPKPIAPLPVETDLPGFEEWKRLQEPSDDVPLPSATEAPPALNTTTPGRSKYNYASPDCGARVHSSSKLSQHASSVLHKSRDRYMLTPCKAEEHWVTIELCDEVRVEAVEISVWEFFSGIVRDVRVSAGEEGEMVEVGTFIGKNVRGVQTFSLPAPTSFYRFLRLDFPSFYGSEYYCPVSQVKVYGMNQLEAFKWEQKKVEEPKAEVEDPAVEEAARARRAEEELRERELGELEKLVQAQAARHNTSLEVDLTNTTKPGRRADSESIYAFIIRRVNDLEGNSSLVARYIDEQSKAMRTMLNKTEREILQKLEVEDKMRWEQERMRQEDRFGRILSQLEQQRTVLELDRRSIESQLRVLADELGFERRRGIAQLLIMIVIIVLGVASRSNTIDALLQPLLAEARRRRKSIKTPRKPIPRSFSTSVDFPLGPRPRSTVPRHSGFTNRRIARNAHLHSVKPKELASEDVTEELNSVKPKESASEEDVTEELKKIWMHS